MEIYFVSRNRLNVYLTDADLTAEAIDIHRLCDGNNRLQPRLKRILEAASEEAHFAVGGVPLEVELFLVSEGDLLVSMCRQAEDGVCGVFADIEGVIACCRALESVPCTADLYLYRGRYYLYVSGASYARVRACFAEFSLLPREESGVSLSVLQEHGKLICEQNCIKIFKKHFKS